MTRREALHRDVDGPFAVGQIVELERAVGIGDGSFRLRPLRGRDGRSGQRQPAKSHQAAIGRGRGDRRRCQPHCQANETSRSMH